MSNYYRMNKILEEEGTMERAEAEAASYADYEADIAIREAEDEAARLESEAED